MPWLINRCMTVFNYNILKQTIGGYLKINLPRFFWLLNRHKTGVKYVFSGSMSALVNLFVLFVLTDIFGVWYLISSIVAFVISHAAGFLMQKFWTFRERGWKRIEKQTAIYVAMGTAEFILTPVLIYTLVEKFHVWYLPASVIVMGSLAIINYSINKFITFKKDTSHESVNV